MSTYDLHPLAEMFPPMQKEEFKDLCADIEKQGLLEPIVIHDGKIIDGRHRSQACKKTGVEPRYETYEGSDPFAFVISKNLFRRHLSIGQRSVLARRVVTTSHGGNRKPDQKENSPLEQVTQKQAAEMFKVSDRSIKDAGKVLDHAKPEVIQAVEQGAISLNAATKTIKKAPDNVQQAQTSHQKGKDTKALPLKRVNGGQVKAAFFKHGAPTVPPGFSFRDETKSVVNLDNSPPASLEDIAKTLLVIGADLVKHGIEGKEFGDYLRAYVTDIDDKEATKENIRRLLHFTTRMSGASYPLDMANVGSKAYVPNFETAAIKQLLIDREKKKSIQKD